MLSMEQVGKNYGKVCALRNLDMTVNEGEVYGFLGRNGAGKSTALQIIMGITLPDTGRIMVLDKPLKGDDPAIRAQVGYVAQQQHFYDWMTAESIGRFVSGFYPTWDHDEFHRLIRLLEIPENRKILGFSGGMRSKLALSLALAHRPPLLLLDEPTAGMDAVARREFIDIVRDQAVRSHRTTLFSSHLIDEVEQAADKVGILDDGVMRFEGSPESLRDSVKRIIMDNRDSDTGLLMASLAVAGEVLQDEDRNSRREIVFLVGEEEGDQARFNEAAMMHQLQVEQLSLEEIFVAMVTRKVAL
jgi:ABC-2 type transport system ATP-binding protein